MTNVAVWELETTWLFSLPPRSAVLLHSSCDLDSIVQRVTRVCAREYSQHKLENVDGIVCCVHTEGSSETKPNNDSLVLRTLSGLLVHPNVGAAIVVFHPSYRPIAFFFIL